MKRLLIVAGGILVLLLGTAAALFLLIDANQFRPLLERELSTALAREVHLGDLKLSLLGGSVSAGDLSIADDPAYSKAPFLQAKSLAIGLEVWPLIRSRKLNVTGLTIEKPVIALIQASSGEWNFSSLGGTARKQPPQPAEPTGAKGSMDLSVKQVRITDAELSLRSTTGLRRPLTLQEVSIDVKDFAAASEFPFALRAKVAGGGTIALDGKAGPLNALDTSASPLSATIKIAGLDLAGSGITQNTPAFAGLIALEGSARSDGSTAHIQGKVKAEKLKLAREGTPARKPVEFEFALDHNLRRRSGRLAKGAIHIGAAPASLTGTYAEVAEITNVHMNLDGPKMAVAELSELLPAMAVVLPRGSSLQGGTASAKISLDGPLNRLVTAGTVSLDNTKLANFDIGQKLAFAQALAGIKANPDTEIQTLGAAVRYGPEGGRVDDLKLVVPSIGNLEGAGTISISNELAFQMRATVRSIPVPFMIQGPAANPSFRPDAKGIAKEGVKGFLRGILSR